MANFCPNCGTKLEYNSEFCSGCGAKVSGDNALAKSVSSPPSLQKKNFGGGYEIDETLQDIFLKTAGRLNRLRYLKRSFLLVLVAVLLDAVVNAVFGDETGDTMTAEIFSTAISLLFVYPSYCLDVRRLHDLDKNNTLALVNVATSIFAAAAVFGDNAENGGALQMTTGLLALVSLGIYLYLFFARGTRGANLYGADPLAR